MTSAEAIAKLRTLFNEYLDGPLGEPNLADAHDFLLAMGLVLDSVDEDDPDLCTEKCPFNGRPW